METTKTGHFIALTPLIIFAGLFFISAYFFSMQISPLFSCLLALIYALCTFKSGTPFNKKLEVFLAGSAHPTIIAMCYIFIFSGVLTYTLKLIGGIDSAVKIGLFVLPQQFLLPGFFIIVSLFALAIGSSMGTIAAFLPIGTTIAHKFGADPALLAGIVVSGAMLGDNLSIISDTTIAATQTTGTHMKDKFKANVILVIPAFILTIFTLIFLNRWLTFQPAALELVVPTLHDFLKIIPYGLVFLFALLGYDVIAVLVLGILAAMAIGIAYGVFSFVQSTTLLVDGFIQSGITEVLILVLFVGGLSYIVEYNGGIQYLLDRFSKRITDRTFAELSIALLVFLVNAAVAINTIAILITGPVAKRIGDQFKIPHKRIASLIDIVACICQGILPYAPQLLLAGSLAKVSSFSIIPYLHYQWFIALVTFGSILQGFKKRVRVGKQFN